MSKHLASSIRYGAIFLLYFGAGLQPATANEVTSSAVVEKLCKEQSEEMLTDMGVAPTAWRAQSNNSKDQFSIEGRWTTRAGVYIVECELPYKGNEESIELKLIKE